MTNLNTVQSVQLVDMLGALKAQQAELKLEEARIKDVLARRAYKGDQPKALSTTFVGRLFEVTMSLRRREVLNTTRIREMFKATGAQLPTRVVTSTNWDVRARKVEAA